MQRNFLSDFLSCCLSFSFLVGSKDIGSIWRMLFSLLLWNTLIHFPFRVWKTLEGMLLAPSKNFKASSSSTENAFKTNKMNRTLELMNSMLFCRQKEKTVIVFEYVEIRRRIGTSIYSIFYKRIFLRLNALSSCVFFVRTLSREDSISLLMLLLLCYVPKNIMNGIENDVRESYWSGRKSEKIIWCTLFPTPVSYLIFFFVVAFFLFYFSLERFCEASWPEKIRGFFCVFMVDALIGIKKECSRAELAPDFYRTTLILRFHCQSILGWDKCTKSESVQSSKTRFLVSISTSACESWRIATSSRPKKLWLSWNLNGERNSFFSKRKKTCRWMTACKHCKAVFCTLKCILMPKRKNQLNTSVMYVDLRLEISKDIAYSLYFPTILWADILFHCYPLFMYFLAGMPSRSRNFEIGLREREKSCKKLNHTDLLLYHIWTRQALIWVDWRVCHNRVVYCSPKITQWYFLSLLLLDLSLHFSSVDLYVCLLFYSSIEDVAESEKKKVVDIRNRLETILSEKNIVEGQKLHGLSFFSFFLSSCSFIKFFYVSETKRLKILDFFCDRSTRWNFLCVYE